MLLLLQKPHRALGCVVALHDLDTNHLPKCSNATANLDVFRRTVLVMSLHELRKPLGPPTVAWPPVHSGGGPGPRERTAGFESVSS